MKSPFPKWVICWEPRYLVLLPKATPFNVLGSQSLFIKWKRWTGWFLGSIPILNPRANYRLIKSPLSLTVYIPSPHCNLLSYLWLVTCTYNLAVCNLKKYLRILRGRSQRRMRQNWGVFRTGVLGVRQTWVWLLAPLLTNCIILTKFLHYHPFSSKAQS